MDSQERKSTSSRIGVLIEYIQSDLFRYYGNTKFKTFVGAYVLNRSFNYSVWLRLAKADLPVLGSIARTVHFWKSRRYLMNIPVETSIGYGLYIAHGMPIAVNPATIIGNNCNLSQFVTIGSNHDKAAKIGDNVYIGPGVCIVEDVSIGSNCIIGAGAVVVRDVPQGSTVVGVPAAVIGPNRHPSYIGHRWPPQN